MSDAKKQPSGPLDRLPPHSEEAERGILGCLMTDPWVAFPEATRAVPRLDATIFYDLRHQAIFAALVSMYDQSMPIDLITVQQRLREHGQLEAVGGLTYLNQILDCIPSASNIGYYLEIAVEKQKTRRVIQVCSAAVCRAYEEASEVETVIHDVESEILKIKDGQATEFVRGARLSELVMNRIDREHNDQRTGIFSGLGDLDRLTGGWQEGEIVVLAGRPAAGKTALALQIALHNAVELGIPVGIFSLEMMAEALGIRMTANLADVDSRAARDHLLDERDIPKLVNAVGRLRDSKLVIDENSDHDIRSIRAAARRMAHDDHVKLLIVDYVQLVGGVSRKAADNRQAEVAEVSTGLKRMAKELRIPVIVLAQLNREAEKRDGKPRMSDLNESGRIEADASFVGILYRATQDPVKQEEENIRKIVPVNMFVPKQREGDSGNDVRLVFHKRVQRFTGAAKVSDEDIPR